MQLKTSAFFVICSSSILLSQTTNNYLNYDFSKATNPYMPLAVTTVTTEKHEELVETNNTKEKPKGVTLPDGTFIPNQPVKISSEHKDKYEIYKRFLQNPRLAAEMAEQGVKLAQDALEHKNANPVVPLDNVRAMYAVAVFLKKGYYFKQNEEASLEWILKAGCAGAIKMTGGSRADNDKLSEQELAEAAKILEAGIKEKTL